jgi:hypothetical protein
MAAKTNFAQQTPEQRYAEMLDAQEFHQIQKFVGACRRQWPGAMIVLRPDGAPVGASPPSNLNPAPGGITMSDFEDDTPTEADIDACYGSKYLSAAEVGNRKIRTKIARVRKEPLQQQGGGTKTKFILAFTNHDKEMVLNSTNVNVLVDGLGKRPADWIDAGVGIYTEPTMFGGKTTKGLRLRVLNKPAAMPAPKPVPPRPAPKAAAAEEAPWPDQPGDPGPDFIDAAE